MSFVLRDGPSGPEVVIGCNIADEVRSRRPLIERIRATVDDQGTRNASTIVVALSQNEWKRLLDAAERGGL